MDNTPGVKQGYVKNMRGLIPSLVNDGLQMNPNAYMGLLSGYSVPGAVVQRCVEEEKMEKDAAEAAAGKKKATEDNDDDTEHFIFDSVGSSSGLMDNTFIFFMALLLFICVFGGMYYFKVGFFQSID